MINAIELIRVSTEAQAGADRASVPAQKTVNRVTAARYSLNIVQTIELTDVSGANVLRAPEIQRLIEMIESPEIGAVITREFSRLMRPEKFSDYALLQAFADTRTKLFLPEGPIDFSEKSGRLMGTIRAAIAGLERSEIQERCWRAKEEKRKAGKNVASRLPFGVGYDKQSGWFYAKESAQVRKAFDMVLAGITNYRAISQRTGLSEGQMFKLLHNPIWIGMRVYEWKCDPTRRKIHADGRQGYSFKMRRDPEDVIRVRVIEKPLVSEREWKSACRIMDAKRDAHRRERQSPSLYCGFLFCDTCGAPLVPVTTHRAAKRYYICRNRRIPDAQGNRCPQGYIRGYDLEAEIDRVLSREVTSPAFAEHIVEQMAANSKNPKAADIVKRLEIELGSAQAKRDRIVESYFDGVLSKSARDQRLKNLDARISAVTVELIEARQARDPGLTAESIAKAFEPFHVWDQLGREDRRRILAVTIPRIRVRDGKVTAFYRLLDECEVQLARLITRAYTRRTKNSQS